MLERRLGEQTSTAIIEPSLDIFQNIKKENYHTNQLFFYLLQAHSWK